MKNSNENFEFSSEQLEHCKDPLSENFESLNEQLEHCKDPLSENLIKNPIDYFQIFFNESILNTIAEETNRYAKRHLKKQHKHAQSLMNYFGIEKELVIKFEKTAGFFSHYDERKTLEQWKKIDLNIFIQIKYIYPNGRMQLQSLPNKLQEWEEISSGFFNRNCRTPFE